MKDMYNIISILIVSACAFAAEASSVKDAHERMRERIKERHRAIGFEPALRPRRQGNSAVIQQSGGSNQSSIVQNGHNNSATVIQNNNATNDADDVQDFRALHGKNALQTRYSSGGHANGAANTSSVIQSGDHNIVEHVIEGENNTITTEQYGDSMTYVIRHKGNDKEDIVIQHSE